MKLNWFAFFPRFEDFKRYVSDEIFYNHYCQNPKCHRLLIPCFDQNNLSIITKLKADFVSLSSMNIYLCSDKFLSVISTYAKNDVCFNIINPNVNLLQIKSTCEINDEFLDEAPLCPTCKITLSRTGGRAFEGNKLKIFKKPDNESSLICRSKITMRDSSSASYDLYVRDDLVAKLERFKCFDMLECIGGSRVADPKLEEKSKYNETK